MRTIRDYNRNAISLLSEYAITTGGAVILKNGSPIDEWTNIVKAYIPNHNEYVAMVEAVRSFPDLKSNFGKLTDDIVVELFLPSTYAKKPLDFIKELEGNIRQKLDLDIWDCNLNQSLNRLFIILKVGNKKYYSKELAIKYLQEQFSGLSISAGDSFWDKGMLELTDIAYSQEGSEVSSMVNGLRLVPSGTAGTAQMLKEIQSF